MRGPEAIKAGVEAAAMAAATVVAILERLGADCDGRDSLVSAVAHCEEAVEDAVEALRLALADEIPLELAVVPRGCAAT